MSSTALESTISNERIFLTKVNTKKYSRPSFIDNSDSEFEMVHHKSHKKVNNEKEPHNISLHNKVGNIKSGNHNSSGTDTDFADNELASFSKSEVQSVKKHLHKLKNTSIKDSLNTSAKNQVTLSSVSSSTSSDDHSELSDSSSKVTHQSSGIPQSPNKGTLKSIGLNENPAADSSDEEEIIPASQDPRSCLQFDLSSGKLDKSNTWHSLSSEEEKSSDNENSADTEDDENSSASEVEKAATPKLQETESNTNQSWLNQLLKKVTNVTRFDNKKSDSTLCFNKISEEEEDVFLIQCPQEIDPKSFKNKNIILNGNSSISLKTNEESYEYDYNAIKDDSERVVNIVIPNEDLSGFCLGKVRIAGSIVLSESIDVPKLEKPQASPIKRVQYPEKLENLCLSLPAPDAPSDHSVSLEFCSYDSYEKNNIEQNDFIGEENVKSHHTKKKKRKRKSDLLENSSTVSPTYSHIKKKRRKDQDEEESNYRNVPVKSEPENEDPEPVKHKKKKKKTSDSLHENFFQESFTKIKQDTEEIHQELDISITKKKKKKSKSTDE